MTSLPITGTAWSVTTPTGRWWGRTRQMAEALGSSARTARLRSGYELRRSDARPPGGIPPSERTTQSGISDGAVPRPPAGFEMETVAAVLPLHAGSAGCELVRLPLL